MRAILSRFLRAALVPAVAVSSLTGVGCSCMNNTERGVVGGGVLGGVAGAVVGSAVGRPGAGAAVGAALGATAGGLNGASQDRFERRVEAREAARQAHVMQTAPTLEQIVQLTGSGVQDGIIISQIRNSGAVYNLKPDDLVYLNNNGVRPAVVQELQSTAGRTVVRPVYVVPGPPPPPVGIGVGVRIR